jgi:hypothetical protein
MDVGDVQERRVQKMNIHREEDIQKKSNPGKKVF